MKAIILSIALSLTLFITNAQSKTVNGQDITVTVPTNSTKGKIILGLHTETTFMKSEPIQGQVGEIKDGKAVVTFKNVPAGAYAITIFHDKNDNKIMDFAANGMPLEDYGASNNAMSYGPPSWSTAKFDVTEKAISMEIRL